MIGQNQLKIQRFFLHILVNIVEFLIHNKRDFIFILNGVDIMFTFGVVVYIVNHTC